MTERLEQYIAQLSERVPLELFTFIGSFLEEIIAPIPSPLVTTAAGTLAEAQGYMPIALLLFGCIAALGKTLGSLLIYVVADKAEDFLLIRIGPRIGVTHADVEKIGSYLRGSIRDYFFLIFIRTLPIVPSLPISVAAGVIKIKLSLYISTTFIGSFLRSMIFLIIGYVGFSAYEEIMSGIDSGESIIKILMVVGLIALVGWAYYARRGR